MTPRGLPYPRRQQLCRLTRAAGFIALAVTALVAAGGVAFTGPAALAGALVLLAVGLFAYARRLLRLAGRAGVGADSEARVRRALAALEREGWRTRHSLPWRGRGDIDHVAIAPTGVAFAIETKTSRYEPRQLQSARSQTAWLRRCRRQWCPRGAFPVLSLVRGPTCERIEDTVLIDSLNRLISVLRSAAATSPRPAILR